MEVKTWAKGENILGKEEDGVENNKEEEANGESLTTCITYSPLLIKS